MPDSIAVNKFRKAENFPVGSLLLPQRARRPIRALYRFARSADEIADDYTTQNMVRKQQLVDIHFNLLMGEKEALPRWAVEYYSQCMDGKMNLKHGIALIEAFIQDTEKKRYASWAQTLEYCQKSAATIGRSFLEAAREFVVSTEFSDKICIVLQLINHLQDLRTDLMEDGRLYFHNFIEYEKDIKKQSESLDVREAKIEVIGKLKEMLLPCKAIFSQIKSFRIRCEIATIYFICEALLEKLLREDILAKRVELTAKEKKDCMVRGVKTAFAERFTGESSAGMALRSGSSFIWPLLRLPAEKRNAILCFYSFCRIIDDVADDAPSNEKDDLILAYLKLDSWKEEVEKIYSANVTEYPLQPISKELALFVAKYKIEKKLLLEMIEGQEMDLKGLMIKPTEQVLDLYCYRVASCVGLISVQIFGYADENREKIKQFAINLGKGLQYINIVRDVQEDAAKGRIYLPRTILLENNYADVGFEELMNNSPHKGEERIKILDGMASKAEEFIMEAEKHLPDEERGNMKAALLMKGIYRKYLDKMIASKYVFERNDIKLTLWEKVKILL